jgi:hypothetical protein
MRYASVDTSERRGQCPTSTYTGHIMRWHWKAQQQGRAIESKLLLISLLNDVRLSCPWPEGMVS